MKSGRFVSKYGWLIQSVAVVLALLCWSSLALASKRLALVIGNDTYLSVSPLKNARNDARLMASALREASFDVTEVNDLDLRRMWRAIETFQGRIGKGDEVVFFFAGHGVQIGSEPVLLPVDIVAESDAQVLRESVALAKVQDAFKDARLALLIIDACRDNPFPARGTRTVGGARGLPTIEAADGTAIIMSASRGQKALDSVPGLTTDNGLFTFEFVRAIRVPGADLRTALQDVRERVEDRAKRAGGQQRPSLVDETRGNFYFFPAQAKPMANAQTAPRIPSAQEVNVPRVHSQEEAEQEYWNVIRESRDARDYSDYLKNYPHGRFVALATRQLRQIQGGSHASSSLPPQATIAPAPRPSNSASQATTNTSVALQEGTLILQGARFIGKYRQEGAERLLTGEGEMQWSNGDVFKGQFLRGERTGVGEMIWKNGQSYRGDWVFDAPSGRGILKFSNGDVYEGMVIQGLPQGDGRMRFASGDVYEGTLTKGKANGKGIYTWKNGQRYDGDWLNDVPHGRGRMAFANGNKYEGDIAGGVPQGQGTMVFDTSDTYTGALHDGKPHGIGQYNWKNGDRYQGAWQAGVKHGQGVFTWVNGDRWQGEYSQDQQTQRGALLRKAP